MGKKILWTVVSGLMALSLVIAACGQASTTITPTTPATSTTPSAPTTPAAEKPQQEAVTPAVERPKYGGTLYLSLGADITSWASGIESC